MPSTNETDVQPCVQASGVVCVVAVAAALIAACATPSVAPSDVRGELEAMFDSDQLYRSRLQALALEDPSRSPANSPEMLELWQKQHEIDKASLGRLSDIVSESGWPDRRVVGDKAAGAAFLVIQHADLAQQKKYLPVLRAAVADGRARGEDLALLEDRILMREGKKQIYGSQLQQRDGAWEFYPIEDEKNVDERRRAVGLPPLAEYAKQFGFEYKPQ